MILPTIIVIATINKMKGMFIMSLLSGSILVASGQYLKYDVLLFVSSV